MNFGDNIHRYIVYKYIKFYQIWNNNLEGIFKKLLWNTNKHWLSKLFYFINFTVNLFKMYATNRSRFSHKYR